MSREKKMAKLGSGQERGGRKRGDGDEGERKKGKKGRRKGGRVGGREPVLLIFDVGLNTAY